MRKDVLRKFLVLFFFLLTLVAKADVQVLEVKEKDGTQVYFALSDKPVLHCSDGELNVSSANSSLSIFLSKVEYFKLSSIVDGISEIKSSKIDFKIEAGNITSVHYKKLRVSSVTF